MCAYYIKDNERTKKKKRREQVEIMENKEPMSFPIMLNLKETIEETKKKVEMIAKEHRKQNRKFRDKSFNLFVNKDECLYRPNSSNKKQSKVYAKRVSTIYENPEFFKDGKEPYQDYNNVMQGDAYNCWLIASLAVITNIKNLLGRICVARDEEVGIYGFIFFKDGKWEKSIIDDQLFTNGKDEKGNWKLTFAKCLNKNETWLPLIEKAYAKIHGNYESINFGYTGQGIEDLTGGVYTSMFTSDILDKEKFWNEEFKRVNKDKLFACCRYEDAELDTKGTYSKHAYSVIRVAEIEKDKKKLVLVRNPYGTEKWKGAWSDGSEEWTPERMKDLKYKFGDNGSFWMAYDDFLNYWDIVDKCRLFDMNWTVNLDWILYRNFIPLKGKFILEVPEESELVIVIQQNDERDLSDPPEFEYQLSFRVYEGEKKNYFVRSQLTSPYGPRSTNLEETFPAGKYQVFPNVERIVKKHSDRYSGHIKKREEMLRQGKEDEEDETSERKEDEEDETGEGKDDEKWEIVLGLRVYSKCTDIILKAEYPEVDF